MTAGGISNTRIGKEVCIYEFAFKSNAGGLGSLLKDLEALQCKPKPKINPTMSAANGQDRLLSEEEKLAKCQWYKHFKKSSAAASYCADTEWNFCLQSVRRRCELNVKVVPSK